MTPDERQIRVREIFDVARQTPMEARPAYLSDACGDDSDLRSEIESLLSNHDDVGMFMDADALAGTGVTDAILNVDVPAEPRGLIGRTIGHYTIKRVIASGGMGTVYEAVQAQPRRPVALKVMRTGITSRTALRRFEYEAQLLARLRHECICDIYEAGVHYEESAQEGGDGIPYFAMEYIPNAKPITEYVEQKKLSIRERLTLFSKVCDAVHHGHQKGIIHRDLKPGNILVDSSGQPKVIDFGVARATDSDMAVTTLQTDVGQLIGTLPYMSPEQFDADPHDLDTRSDVYALGVILYEMLCGQRPHDLSQAMIHEAARIVREDAPARPSTINRVLRGDVETITLKAMAKERDRRYESAWELGRDVERFLNDEPIEARPASVGYRLRILARRNRALAAAITIAIVGLIVATVALATGLTYAIIARNELAGANAQLVRERDLAKWQEYRANILTTQLALKSDFTVAKTAKERLDSAESSLRDWEWGHLSLQFDSSIATHRWAPSNRTSIASYRQRETHAVAISAQADRYARSTAENLITIHDLYNASELSRWTYPGPPIRGLALSHSAHLIAIVTDSEVTINDTVSGAMITSAACTGVQRISFDHAGDRFAVLAEDVIQVWSTVTGELVASFDDLATPTCFAFNPVADQLAAGSRSGLTCVWDLSTREVVQRILGEHDGIFDVAFTRDGTGIMLLCGQRLVLQDLESGDSRTVVAGEISPQCAAISSDGQVIAGGVGEAIEVWELETGNEVVTLRGHVGPAIAVEFTSNGRHIASVSLDGTIRLWNRGTGQAQATIGTHARAVQSMAFSPDSSLLVSGGADGTIAVWNALTGEEIALLRGHEGVIHSVAFAPDGSWFATADTRGNTMVWDPTTGVTRLGWRGAKIVVPSIMAGDGVSPSSGDVKGVIALAPNPDGSDLAVAFDNGELCIWDTEDGEPLQRWLVDPQLTRIAYLTRPDRIVTASGNGQVKIWDVEGERELASWRAHEESIAAIAVHPNRGVLATASADETVRLWDLKSGRLLHTLFGHSFIVGSVAFNTKGTRLLSAPLMGTARVWNPQTGDEVIALQPPGQPSRFGAVAISPDGTQFATGMRDGRVIVWDSMPAAPREIERRRFRRAQQRAAPWVDTLFDRGMKPSEIAAQIRGTSDLDNVAKQAARNHTLRRSVASLSTKTGSNP